MTFDLMTKLHCYIIQKSHEINKTTIEIYSDYMYIINITRNKIININF